MLRNYIKVALRSLQRNKVFSFINIFGLAIGLTCCMLITLYIVHENSYDSYQKNANRLFQVGTVDIHTKASRFWGCPNTLAGIFKSIYPQIEATARMCRLVSEDKTLIQYGGHSFYEEKGYMADSGFFHLFTYHFTEGSAETAISGPYSIVLSTDIATKLFGAIPALGKTVHISSATNGEHDYTVTAVFQPEKRPSHLDGRFFLSMYGGNIGDFIRTYTNTASNYFFVTYILLKKGADPKALEARFPDFVRTYEGKDLAAVGSTREHFLLPVKDIHLHADMEYGDITPSGSLTALYILGSIALFTLLIACINFMNLATARSIKRSGEVGVRKVLGAGRSSLVRQFLGESLLMALIAFGIGVFLTFLLFPAFETISGKTMTLSSSSLLILGSAFLGLAIITGLLSGSYPALYLSSFQPVKVLKGKSKNSLAVASLRKGLVVFQFVISIILIVASVVIARQMHYMRTADLGFQKDHQLIVPLTSPFAKKAFNALRSQWLQDANVLSVAGSAFYPGGERPGWDPSFYPVGKSEKENHHVYLNYVDFDFMKSLKLQAVAGHIFTADLPSDSVDGIVMNEQAVRQMGFTPAASIGKRVHQLGGDQLTIVGVVRDFNYEDLHTGIEPMAFEVYSSFDNFSYMTVHLNSANMGATIHSLENGWRKIDPGEPFEYVFMDAQLQQHYDADGRLATIVGYFTAIAICISCLGLFGLAAFSAEQRTKEIGIRKVLGASEGSILVLLSGDFLKLVAFAILIGSPVAWYVMRRWLQDFAYRTNISWTVFAVTTTAALLIALVTISFQALRAARSNPVESLRAE